MRDKWNHSPAVAAVTASLLMVGLGLVYGVMAARMEEPSAPVPIAPDALDRFPSRVGQWTGDNLPLDEAVARGTRADALISRRYSRTNDPQPISLYIACGVRTWEIAYHRPTICYPGSGWVLVQRYPLSLPLKDGNTLPCTILEFTQGELTKEKATVLHFWAADGQLFRDVSLLQSRLWRLSAKVSFLAQIQIGASSPEALTSESLLKSVCAFATDSASAIRSLFADVEESHRRALVCLKETEDEHR